MLPNEENQQIVNEYLMKLKTDQRPKGNIILTRKILQSFFQEIDLPFSTLTMQDVNQWKKKKEKNCRINTIRYYLSTLRCFFKYCVEKGSIEKQPIPCMWREGIGENFWKLKVTLSNGENHQIVHNYLLMLKTEQRAKDEIINTRNILQSFFQVLESPISEITIQDAEHWLLKKEKTCNKNTIKRYRKTLRSFFRYCVEKDLIDKQPVPYKQRGNGGNYWGLTIVLPNEENHQKVNEYLNMLKNEQWTKKTIVTYRHTLQSFFKKIEAPFSTLSMHDVERWLTKEKKVSNQRARIIYVSHIRSFFSYCLDNGFIEKQPITFAGKEVHEDDYWKITIPLVNEENKKVLNEFLMSLKIANYSKKTVKNYRFFLQKFFKDRQEIFSDFTSNQIQQWFIQHEKGLKEVTIKSHLTTLSSFYNFCVEEAYTERSPIKSRMFPRRIKSIPKYLDKEEIAKVRGKSEKLWIRNRSIFEFLFSSGCRISELHGLDRSDVDMENRIAMVLGKGKKYRQIHFSEKCAIILERYLETRTDTHAALFVSSKKKVTRLSTGQMRKILNGLGKDAGMKSSLHPHRLRHTFATELLSKGADLLFIADELGHTNIETTQIYANLPKQEMITLYRKYMG